MSCYYVRRNDRDTGTLSMTNKWCRHRGTPHEQRALLPTSTVNLRSDASPRTFSRDTRGERSNVC